MSATVTRCRCSAAFTLAEWRELRCVASALWEGDAINAARHYEHRLCSSCGVVLLVDLFEVGNTKPPSFADDDHWERRSALICELERTSDVARQDELLTELAEMARERWARARQAVAS